MDLDILLPPTTTVELVHHVVSMYDGKLTEPLVGPSCAEVPLTLKLTPLGAFVLTSSLAALDLSFGT